jgi:ectoine hydroxylase-related dioxygenase (phytanoyl-CoA dioxygenase family)
MVGVMVDAVEQLERDGYALLDDMLTSDQVEKARAELERLAADTPYGRDDFEGHNTRRVYALFGKTRALDDLATHPRILTILDHFLGEYHLSAPTAIEIGPGEGRQPLHPDDAIYPIPRPHPELVVNIMWPLVDFTEANGATRIVRGSHQWIDKFPAPDEPTVAVEMSAGSALVYLGSVWHGGGANHTDAARLGVVLHYARAWLRPVENHTLVVPPEVATTLSPRLQELLGYNICSPFIGYVDGRHPRKLLADLRSESRDAVPVEAGRE